MALHRIADAQHQGMLVAVFEHPQTWTAQSQVVWNFQNTSLPVWIQATAFNPHGAEALEFLPVEAYYWLEPNYGFDVIGQSKYGLVCLPPMPAADAMTRYVIPKYRGNQPNLRIKGIQPVPNLPQLLRDFALAQTATESVCVQIEYEADGRMFEEEFYGVKTQTQAGGATSLQVNWGFARLLCFRAERNQLEAARETFWRIASSVEINQQWQGLFNQIVQQLNAQHGAMINSWQAKLEGEKQFQAQLTNYYQEQRDRQNADIAAKIEMDQRHRQVQETTLTAQERWRNELGAETAYVDPNSAEGNVIYHSSNDRVVYMNEQGVIAGSEDPNFDPNINSPHTWKRLREA